MNKQIKYRLIGKIISTHGIKGELKIKSTSDFTEKRYKVGNLIYFKSGNNYESFVIRTHRTHKGMELITIDEYININDILKYVGLDVYTIIENNDELEENEYYYDDLIGSKAYDEGLVYLGEVVDIIEVPQGELIELIKPNGKKGLIPFVDEFIKEVDVAKKQIIIHLIEGLL